MKWIFVFKEKIKVALALTVATTAILLINLVMSRNVSEIDESVTSIYNDRMVAGQDISKIIEVIYQNQLLVEEHIHAEEVELYDRLERKLAHNHLVADSLISHFKKTVMTAEESQTLKVYEQNNGVYKVLQGQLIALSRRGEKELAYRDFLQHRQDEFQRVLRPAHQLVAIQAAVGKQIYHTLHQNLQMAQLLSSLETAIAIVFGLIILLLLKASSLILPKPQKYWLN
jgi:hypothetical protein